MRSRSLALSAAAALLVLAVVWAAPSRVVDADALSRLAMGRLLVEHARAPLHDPWTFGAPEVPFGNPEWLGDLAWYALYERFGERGLQAAAVSCGALGYVLALALGITLGGRPASVLALLLCTLPAAAPRISPRNDVHLFWLFPVLCWLCAREPPSARRWLGLLALGAVWANLHSSFVVAWPFLLLALRASTPVVRRWAVFVVLAYPALPFLGPSGASSYRQLLDHLLGAGVYRSLLSEWQSPLSSTGWLAIMPLYVLIVLGAGSFIAERPRALQVLMFGVGCALALASRRFLPAMAYLVAPAMAGPLEAAAMRLGRSARWLALAAAASLLAYLALAARSSAQRQQASVFDPDERQAAIAFLREHAPRGSRVANAFNDGPWLLWFGHGAFQHYLDPRNNLGARVLERYVHEVIADASAFEREAERLRIDLVLVPQRDPAWSALLAHLSGAARWRLSYWDGRYALFARDAPQLRAFLERHAYRAIAPTLDLRYLARRATSAPDLEADLTRLASQSRVHATVIRAYLQLREAGGRGPRAVQAAQAIEAAWPQLDDTAGLAQALQEIESGRR